MAERYEVRVPDLGGAEEVRVVEVLVAAGDRVAVDQGLLTLESEKASLDVPSPRAGEVVEIAVGEGDEVEEGDLIAVLELAADEDGEAESKAEERGEDEGQEEAEEDGDEPPRGDEGDDGGDGGAEEAEGEEEPAPAGRPGPRPSDVAPGEELTTEVVVLGAGPGGYTAAFRAADLGRQVVLVERYPTLGGVCLNVGCIPSKALLHVAAVMEEVDDLAEHGVAYGEPELDLDRLRAFVEGVVGRLTDGLAKMAERRGVRVVQGVGTFASPHQLEVERDGEHDGERDGETTVVRFDHAVVAVGSRPIRLPGIPSDDPRVIDSTGALALADVPEKLLLVGGGIIGLEMAMVYGSLGSELTVVELLDGLIPGCDRDLVRPLERRLKKRFGATIHLGTKVVEVEAGEERLLARFEGGEAPEGGEFDRILVAVGRRPNGDSIGAAAAGLEVDDRGFLPVDSQQRTNVPHIFAIGDVVGEPMLAHKASHEAKVAAEVIAGHRRAFDARAIPSVAYTDPEIAWVGLTETRAKEEGIAYEKGSFPWAASGRSLGMGRDDGLTKLLVDPESGRVLGAGVVGPSAGDLISELALAIEMDCEAADLALTIHPHPTLSETISFAAEAWEGTITDLYLPKQRKR